jgi:hypothetical protein
MSSFHDIYKFNHMKVADPLYFGDYHLLPNVLLWGSQGFRKLGEKWENYNFYSLSKAPRPWLSLPADC